MIIDCISDLHGFYPKLEGGDLLIVAGDLTARDTKKDYIKLMRWHDLISFKYKKSIFIGGNHDNLLQKYGREIAPSFCECLCDSGTEFEGLKIWGSPWTKRFERMNPHCMAFTVNTDEELAEKWKLIPEDIDILVTHCPPKGVFDTLNCAERTVGSQYLRELVWPDKEQKLKLHVFGHIHENGGLWVKLANTYFVNASHVNSVFDPVNKPVRIEL